MGGGDGRQVNLYFFYIFWSLLNITWAYIEVLNAALSLSEETACVLYIILGLGLA